MNSLFAAMQQDTAVRKLQECFGGAPAETLVYGLSGPAKHVAFASCFCKYPQPVVILVHSRDAAREWKEDLEVLLPDRTGRVFDSGRTGWMGKDTFLQY